MTEKYQLSFLTPVSPLKFWFSVLVPVAGVSGMLTPLNTVGRHIDNTWHYAEILSFGTIALRSPAGLYCKIVSSIWLLLSESRYPRLNELVFLFEN